MRGPPRVDGRGRRSPRWWRATGPADPTGTTWRKLMAFLDGALTQGTETTPREILSMLAVVLVFILVYNWLDEIRALVGHPCG